MDQRHVWDDVVGDGWVRHAAFIDRHSEPFGRAAIEALGPIGGADVVDIGCGTGTTSLALAQAGAGSVLGLDLSGRMIAHATTRLADERALADRVRFDVIDVTTLTPPEGFDVAFSRFGVMFFADAVEGFRAIRNMVRPGGRLAFAAWTDPFSNPWMIAPVMASFEVLGPPTLPGPGEPGPFSLGEPDHIHEVLGAAGWDEVAVDRLDLTLAFDDGGPEATAATVVETNPVLALGLAPQPDRLDALRRAIADALALHAVDGVVTFAASAHIVTARA